jgi:hypothetical protein
MELFIFLEMIVGRVRSVRHISKANDENGKKIGKEISLYVTLAEDIS